MAYYPRTSRKGYAMKVCMCCKLEKTMTAFPLAQRRKDGSRQGDGRRAVCKACDNAKEQERKRGWSRRRKADHAKYMTDYMRQWKQQKPWYQKTAAANLHARRVGASGVLQTNDVENVWVASGGKCWVCGCPATELDHYRPINGKSGGTNTADNIRPICRECNQKRSHQWHGEDVAEKEAGLLRQLKALLNEAR